MAPETKPRLSLAWLMERGRCDTVDRAEDAVF
jgi:hypothetical protein